MDVLSIIGTLPTTLFVWIFNFLSYLYKAAMLRWRPNKYMGSLCAKLNIDDPNDSLAELGRLLMNGYLHRLDPVTCRSVICVLTSHPPPEAEIDPLKLKHMPYRVLKNAVSLETTEDAINRWKILTLLLDHANNQMIDEPDSEALLLELQDHLDQAISAVFPFVLEILILCRARIRTDAKVLLPISLKLKVEKALCSKQLVSASGKLTLLPGWFNQFCAFDLTL